MNENYGNCQWTHRAKMGFEKNCEFFDDCANFIKTPKIDIFFIVAHTHEQSINHITDLSILSLCSFVHSPQIQFNTLKIYKINKSCRTRAKWLATTNIGIRSNVEQKKHTQKEIKLICNENKNKHRRKK